MSSRRIKPIATILSATHGRSLPRSLGPVQLTLLGVGAVIGTGIFVLTSEAATKAGPAMMISFLLAALVCGLTALCYAELAAMMPVSGSAYTYCYASFGELTAWLVGWSLVLEYAVSGSTVAVGWSGYTVGLLHDLLGIDLGATWTRGPLDAEPGFFNVPAFMISIAMAALLYVGTRESARFNAVMVVIKLAALALFIGLALSALRWSNFIPFNPFGFFKHEVVDPVNTASGHLVAVGIAPAAASIFFAYTGFDAVSTAAEETKNPNRNIPIGLISSLGICTIFYLLVAVGAVGAIGAQPGGALSRSHDGLAFVMRVIHQDLASAIIQIAAGIALPSVVLMMMFGQTRIAFVMARDGLLPASLSHIHPRFQTPHVITVVTGIFVAVFAGLFPVGQLADISNSGTLVAFAAVAIGTMVLRAREPGQHRPFRTPALWFVAPLAAAGCLFLFTQLGAYTLTLFVCWVAAGLVVYFGYSRSRSNMRPSDTAPRVTAPPPAS